MSDKKPHISLPPDRLIPRVLGISPDQFETWPEDVQNLAVAVASELFLLRYNPFVAAADIIRGVDKRLDEAKRVVAGEYLGIISKGKRAYWQSYEEDQTFKAGVLEKLAEFLPGHCINVSPHSLVETSTDATDLRLELPLALLTPENTGQIQRIVRLANIMGFSIIPRGGGSGATGGAIPARTRIVVLSLSRLKSILSIDRDTKVLCAQTGVITLDAIKAAAAENLLLTVDPASKAASSLGGNISENAGGPFAFEYGTTLDNILSYKMVMPNGDLVDVRRKDHPRHKILPQETAVFEIHGQDGGLLDVVSLGGGDIRGPGLGKDVSNKYLGGLPGVQKEGVDGVITEACFTLHDKPTLSRTLCLEFYGRSMHNAMLVINDVVGLRDNIRAHGDLVKISALEEFNSKYVRAIEYQKKSTSYEGEPISVLLIQLDSDDEAALDRSVHDIIDIVNPYENVDIFAAEDEKQAELFWEDRHKLSAIAKRTSGFKINEDIVIPLRVIPEFADFMEQLNLYYLAKAYRLALQKVSQLHGILPSDEFISMEMQFAVRLLSGEVSAKDLSDQEFEVQTYFFFRDLIGRYPKKSVTLETFYQNMLATRIVVASHMHAGDGNCHVNIPVNSNDPEMMAQAMEVADKVFEKVMELGGAVSGEHGIGITKIAFLQEDKIWALKKYKQQVDPKGVFNPGKLTQRGLDFEPYTFSFNRLIQDLRRTALPEKERLIKLLTDIQVCTRCGKCKQVCPMFQPGRGMVYHPRNKNISLGALIEAIYYSQVQHGEPKAELLAHLQNLIEHCTACGKCAGVCPVKINSSLVALEARAFLEEKQAGGHPLKNKVLAYLAEEPEKRVPQAAKLLAWGQQGLQHFTGLVPGVWRRRFESPLFHGPTPSIGLKNLYETVHLDQGVVFLPENPSFLTETVFYFPGCGASLFSRTIGMGALHLLLRAGVAVIIPDRHMCCGYPLLASGSEGAFLANRARNLDHLQKLFVACADAGAKPQYILTSCGTCREGLSEFDWKTILGITPPHQDVVQFLVERMPQPSQTAASGPDRLLYHPSCHVEWTGQNPAKAPEIYRKAIETLTGVPVDISPGCCAESGLGALTSPAIYNRIRERKKEQLALDLAGAPDSRPVVVGCPSCRIGIRRCLMAMGKKQPVLHSVELLAEMIDGPKWKRAFKKLISQEHRRGRTKK
jgi:FAD/FMN-containing dehydrogenase/Fe-S oxidoreductase